MHLNEMHVAEAKSRPPLLTVADSGSTITVLREKGYFIPGTTRAESLTVGLGKGEMDTTMSGLVRLRTSTGHITLRAHLCESAKRSVLSIPQLCDMGYFTLMGSTEMQILDAHMNHLLVAKRPRSSVPISELPRLAQDGKIIPSLYEMDDSHFEYFGDAECTNGTSTCHHEMYTMEAVSTNDHSTVVKEKSVERQVLESHLKLCHCGVRRVGLIIEKSGIKGARHYDIFCASCAIGKGVAQNTKKKSALRTTRAGEVIFADTKGPKTKSSEGYTYYTVVKDRHTSAMDTIYLRQRADGGPGLIGWVKTTNNKLDP